MKNNFKVIVIQDDELFDIAQLYIAPKDLDPKVVEECIDRFKNENYHWSWEQLFEVLESEFNIKPLKRNEYDCIYHLELVSL